MTDSRATSILFGPSVSVLGLLERGLVDRTADLTPALMGTPALLSRHLDPNASARAKALATAKVCASSLVETFGGGGRG